MPKQMNLDKICIGIVKAHISKHQATFDISEVSQNNYYAVISHPKLTSNVEEHINLNGLSEDIAIEYLHCRLHGLAASLISKLYPERIFPL
jgi:hypothetical protein